MRFSMPGCFGGVLSVEPGLSLIRCGKSIGVFQTMSNPWGDTSVMEGHDTTKCQKFLELANIETNYLDRVQ